WVIPSSVPPWPASLVAARTSRSVRPGWQQARIGKRFDETIVNDADTGRQRTALRPVDIQIPRRRRVLGQYLHQPSLMYIRHDQAIRDLTEADAVQHEIELGLGIVGDEAGGTRYELLTAGEIPW